MKLKGFITALFTLLLTLTLAFRPAHAQGEITIDSLTIRVWSEFDQPEGLVFLIGQTALDVPVPVELTFTLPGTATLHATAYEDATGNLLTLPGEMKGNELTVQSPNGSFYIEFYDSALAIDGESRAYTLDLAMPYAVNRLTTEVQHPAGAGDVTVIPSSTESLDRYNLPISIGLAEEIAAGERVAISLTYVKPSSALSVDILGLNQDPAGGSGTGETVPSPAVNSGEQLPTGFVIGLGVVSILLIAGAIYWYTHDTGKAKTAPALAAKANRRAARKSGSSPAGGRRFCTQCGQEIDPADKFCRNCGAAT
jgi:hypothetical protein